jgi:hypothetical protein
VIGADCAWTAADAVPVVIASAPAKSTIIDEIWNIFMFFSLRHLVWQWL